MSAQPLPVLSATPSAWCRRIGHSHLRPAAATRSAAGTSLLFDSPPRGSSSPRAGRGHPTRHVEAVRWPVGGRLRRRRRALDEGSTVPSARRTGRLSDRDRTPRMLGERASCVSRVHDESRTRRTLQARTGAHCWLSPPPPSRSSKGLGYRRLVNRLEIRAFADEHLDAAGSLLAARHREHRAAEPLLSERFEQPDATREEVASLWAEKHASGAVALLEGRVVGFLLGTRKDDRTRGANVWVEAAGYAADEPELVRDRYAFSSQRWVDEGRTRHYALV